MFNYNYKPMKRKPCKSLSGASQRIFTAAICFLMFFSAWSCKDDETVKENEYNPNLPVKVTDIAPVTGGIAKPIVISGENFGTDKSKIKLYLGDKEAVVIKAQNEHLYAVVPKLKGGEHTVRVVVDEKNEGVLADKKFDYIVASSVSTVAGLGVVGEGNKTDDGEALEAKFYNPVYLCMDDKENIIVIDGSSNVRLLSLAANTVVTLMQTSSIRKGVFTSDFSYLYVPVYSSSQTRIAYEFYRDGNWAQGLIVNTDNIFTDRTTGMVIDEHDNKFIIGGTRTGKIAKIDKQGIIRPLGNWPRKYDYGTLLTAYNPLDKHIYVSSQYEHIIVRFDSRKEQLTDDDFEIFAGQFQVAGFYNGYRTEATFNEPYGIAFDNEGNLFVADQANHAIRKIDPEGNVTTFAGTGKEGYKDGEIETSQFNNPTDVTVSPDGIVYVADYYNYRIRCIAVQ